MRFRQLDRINVLVPGERIEAELTLRGDEDYLQDHFPRFPVQPGVLMLESLFQAAQFLVRATEDYQSGLVMLKEARNVKFAAFLQPGDTLLVEVEIIKEESGVTTVKASGRNSSGATCVSGRLLIQCIRNTPATASDQWGRKYIREIVQQLQQASMAGGQEGYNLASSDSSR